MSEELDPRQIAFLDNYLNPESDTFSNALQSGIKAGFSQEYSENIMSLMPKWLSENIEDSHLVTQALKNLRDLLIGEDDKIKADLTKFVLERLNKKKFSAKSEIDLTSKGEQIKSINYIIPDGTEHQTDNETTPSL